MQITHSFRLSTGRVINATAYWHFLLLLSALHGTRAEIHEMESHFTALTGKKPICGGTALALLQSGRVYAAQKVTDYLASVL